MHPDFIIIGAFKAGTTSLHHYFDQHPEVFMTIVKEPNFFSFDPNNPFHVGEGKDLFKVKTLTEYERLFSTAPASAKKGEASPSYFMSPLAPARIHQTLPKCKLILSLRNPVERAYSAYQMAVREGRTTVRVEDVDLTCDRRMLGSLYSEPLVRYLDLFDNDSFRVVLFDDLRRDANAIMQNLFDFIGVAEYHDIDTGYKFNPGGLPRRWMLHRLLNAIKKIPGIQNYTPRYIRSMVARIRDRNLKKAQPLSPDIKVKWLSYFRDDILRTQDLIGRDLGHWLLEEVEFDANNTASGKNLSAL
jgi:hypothetical protein